MGPVLWLFIIMDCDYIAIIQLWNIFSGIYIIAPPPLHPPSPTNQQAFLSAPRQLVFDSTLFTDGLLLLVISPMISSYTRHTHGAHTLSHHSHHLHKCRVSVAIHVSSTVHLV